MSTISGTLLIVFIIREKPEQAGVIGFAHRMHFCQIKFEGLFFRPLQHHFRYTTRHFPAAVGIAGNRLYLRQCLRSVSPTGRYSAAKMHLFFSLSKNASCVANC